MSPKVPRALSDVLFDIYVKRLFERAIDDRYWLSAQPWAKALDEKRRKEACWKSSG